VAAEPVQTGLAGVLTADGQRVARSVRGVTQRLLDDLRGRVDGRADREVDDPVRVGPGAGRVLGQAVPGEVAEPGGD